MMMRVPRVVGFESVLDERTKKDLSGRSLQELPPKTGGGDESSQIRCHRNVT